MSAQASRSTIPPYSLGRRLAAGTMCGRTDAICEARSSVPVNSRYRRVARRQACS